VFIDTAGSGADWSDEIAMVADHLVTPVLPSDADIAICAQTVEWFKRLRGRVAEPERLPTHNVIITRFPAQAKTTKVHQRMLDDAMQRFPLIGVVVQERTAYVEMDEQGFLGELVKTYRQHADPLQRSQARRFEEAVVESSAVLTDILKG
jgi:chromosome partitioning protein